MLAVQAGPVRCELRLLTDPEQACSREATRRLRNALDARSQDGSRYLPEVVRFIVPNAAAIHPERLDRMLTCLRTAIASETDLVERLRHAHKLVELQYGNRSAVQRLFQRPGNRDCV